MGGWDGWMGWDGRSLFLGNFFGLDALGLYEEGMTLTAISVSSFSIL